MTREGNRKPEILDTRLVAKSRLFGIEEMHLRFSNGEERTYERLRTPPIAGVMCVPMLDRDTVVLIREYGAGVEDYQITLPKGITLTWENTKANELINSLERFAAMGCLITL